MRNKKLPAKIIKIFLSFALVFSFSGTLSSFAKTIKVQKTFEINEIAIKAEIDKLNKNSDIDQSEKLKQINNLDKLLGEVDAKKNHIKYQLNTDENDTVDIKLNEINGFENITEIAPHAIFKHTLPESQQKTNATGLYLIIN